jgi:hypothetical protein
MFERISGKNFPTKKVLSGSLAAVALGASIKYGGNIVDGIEKIGPDQRDSLIVAGAPGQIETWYSNRVWVGKFFIYNNWLGVEQCPADIEAAKRGELSETYDQNIGEMNPDCVFDWVKVSGSTLSSVTLGDPIVFSGPVGEHLYK